MCQITLEVLDLPAAFMLVSIKPGMDTIVLNHLKNADITEIYQVFGLYDLIVKTTEQDEMEQIEEIVSSIRQLEGITKTVTMLVR